MAFNGIEREYIDMERRFAVEGGNQMENGEKIWNRMYNGVSAGDQYVSTL